MCPSPRSVVGVDEELLGAAVQHENALQAIDGYDHHVLVVLAVVEFEDADHGRIPVLVGKLGRDGLEGELVADLESGLPRHLGPYGALVLPGTGKASGDEAVVPLCEVEMVDLPLPV
jgi:hypothetical protein